MKKRVFGMKLSRGMKARRALKRSLLRAFVVSGKLTSTKAKIVFVQRDIEKMVSLAKKASLSNVRLINSYTGNNRDVVDRLLGIARNNFPAKKYGFTRMINLPKRRGDNAPMARLEWVETVKEKDTDKESKKSKAKETEKNDKEEYKNPKGLKKLITNNKK